MEARADLKTSRTPWRNQHHTHGNRLCVQLPLQHSSSAHPMYIPPSLCPGPLECNNRTVIDRPWPVLGRAVGMPLLVQVLGQIGLVPLLTDLLLLCLAFQVRGYPIDHWFTLCCCCGAWGVGVHLLGLVRLAVCCLVLGRAPRGHLVGFLGNLVLW